MVAEENRLGNFYSHKELFLQNGDSVYLSRILLISNKKISCLFFYIYYTYTRVILLLKIITDLLTK